MKPHATKAREEGAEVPQRLSENMPEGKKATVRDVEQAEDPLLGGPPVPSRDARTDATKDKGEAGAFPETLQEAIKEGNGEDQPTARGGGGEGEDESAPPAAANPFGQTTRAKL